MPRRLTIGLVGCGRWGRHILRDLIALGCDVDVVTRADESAALARQGGAARVMSSVAELGDVDAAVVATPTSTHAEIVLSLIPRAIPVFVEKPLSNSVTDADAIVGLAGERVFVMDKWRYHPGVEMLRHIAASGELGPTVGLHLARTDWGTTHTDVDPVWTLAPHDISIALEIFGYIPAPRSAVMEPEGRGLVALLGETPWCVIDVSSNSLERRRSIRLVCRDGVAVIADSHDDHVRIARTAERGLVPVVERRGFGTELPLMRELAAFIGHVRGGPPPRSSAAEAAANVRALTTLRELAGSAP